MQNVIYLVPLSEFSDITSAKYFDLAFVIICLEDLMLELFDHGQYKYIYFYMTLNYYFLKEIVLFVYQVCLVYLDIFLCLFRTLVVY